MHKHILHTYIYTHSVTQRGMRRRVRVCTALLLGAAVHVVYDIYTVYIHCIPGHPGSTPRGAVYVLLRPGTHARPCAATAQLIGTRGAVSYAHTKHFVPVYFMYYYY